MITVRIDKLDQAGSAGTKEVVKSLDKIEAAIREISKTNDIAEILFSVVTLTQREPKFWEKGVEAMQLKSNEQSVASIIGEDAEGNPAAVAFDAVPAWSVDDPAIVTVTPSPDGLTCVIGSPTPGPLGSAIVTLDVVVMGTPLKATLAVDIIAGNAVAIQIVTAPPTGGGGTAGP